MVLKRPLRPVFYIFKDEQAKTPLVFLKPPGRKGRFCLPPINLSLLRCSRKPPDLANPAAADPPVPKHLTVKCSGMLL